MKTGRRLSSYDTCTLRAVRCLDIARNKISMLYLRHRRYTNTTAPHRQSTPSILFVVILSTKEICTYWILGSRRPFCWERHSWTHRNARSNTESGQSHGGSLHYTGRFDISVCLDLDSAGISVRRAGCKLTEMGSRET